MTEVWDYTIGKVLRKAIEQSSPKRCFGCDTYNNLTIHHIVPITNGGLDIEENRVLLCRPCHDLIHFAHKMKRADLNDKQFLERLFYLKLYKQLEEEFKI